jgi:chromosome segregation ATPase
MRAVNATPIGSIPTVDASVAVDRPREREGGIGPAAPKTGLRPHPIRNWVERHQTWLFGALALVLAVAIVAAGVYGKAQLDDRDDTIAGLRQEVSGLAATNGTLQEQFGSLTDERDAFSVQVGQLTTERDQLTGEVQDLGRQLSQARTDVAREQERAVDAEGRVIAAEGVAESLRTQNTRLQGLVRLDDEIQQEFMNLTGHLAASFVAYYDGDYVTAEAEANLADATVVQLDELLTQRESLRRAAGQ